MSSGEDDERTMVYVERNVDVVVAVVVAVVYVECGIAVVFAAVVNVGAGAELAWC